MSYIRTISERDAEGDLASLYRRAGNPDGTVDNVMKVHSLSPASLRAHFELYATAMHKPSPLSRVEREIVGTAVSRLNGCSYCAAHHGAGLKRLLKGEREGLPEALRAGEPADLTPKERAMVGYAEKLTRQPDAMNDQDVAALRDAGLDDREIHDLAQVAAYFNFANRLVNGLGAQIEEFPLGQHPETA